MQIKEAIEHFEVIRSRYRKHLTSCQAKQNRLPEEEKNIRDKIDAATLAINALQYVNRKKIDTGKWMADLWNASWED